MYQNDINSYDGFSEDTEVKTDHGWKLVKDININTDHILSLNPKTHEIEYVKLIDKIDQPYNGILLHFHNKSTLDILVAPKCKLLITNNRTAKGCFQLKSANNIRKSNLLPFNYFKYSSFTKQPDPFILHGVQQLQQYSRKVINVPDKIIDLEAWLQFFGFWLADGCWRDHINSYGHRDYTISIKQNEKLEKYVLSLIKNIGFKARITRFKNHNNNYNIYSKQLWIYLQQFGRSDNKYIPEWILQLPKKYLQTLLNSYYDGDGYVFAHAYHYSSRSLKLMNGLQELLLKIYGKLYQIRTINTVYRDKPYVYYMISANHSRKSSNFAKYNIPTQVEYHNHVCNLILEKNHIMLARRHMKTFWIGDTNHM